MQVQKLLPMAGNGQAEAITAGGSVTRPVEAGKRRENMFAFFGWDAYTVVVDVNQDAVVNQLGADQNLLAGIFEGIAQEVAQGVRHGLAVEVDVEVFRQFFSVDRNISFTAKQAYRIDLIT